ncbi:MAG: RloB domain-containing protein [Coriobacteriaceae bacterium]|nr:RloB domain-containing protein [Coriobacteriaceae bacterium]
MGTDNLFHKRKKPKERKAGSRKPKSDSYLIVTEGEQTEPNYFKGLAKSVQDACAGGRIDVPVFDIQGEGRNTVSLVKEAVRINDLPENNYQHVWVVFDKDDFDDFEQAIKLAHDCGFNVAWSNQSFEYWLCLYFDYMDGALDRTQYCTKLSTIFKRRRIDTTGYHKNKENIYELVTNNGNVTNAIEFAKKRRRELEEHLGQKSNRSDWDPCTTVDLLVSELNSYLR